jgi:hypothetical protein
MTLSAKKSNCGQSRVDLVLSNNYNKSNKFRLIMSYLLTHNYSERMSFWILKQQKKYLKLIMA